jgi:RND superfamily putative drug exporter
LKRVTGAETAEVTGALPATRAETDIANRDILWVELATVLLVVGILAFYFRSAGVPLLELGAVAIAYLVADRVLGWIAQRYGLSIPREAEPVIIALIFGTLTDYLVFFVAGYRQRLQQGIGSRDAVTEVTGELLPVILTAALMIAGATLTLLISGVRFLSAFGPSMSLRRPVGCAILPSATRSFAACRRRPRPVRAMT